MDVLKYTYLLLFILILGACGSEDDPIVNPPTEPREYELVWSDEFDVDGRPNPANWNYEYGFWRNEELQWYKEENAFVENGVLVIEAKRDTTDNWAYTQGSTNWKESREKAYFSSASLETKGLHDWKYGRFEIRAKIVAEEGLWPAIWTLGTGDINLWPQYGEIDIMEYYDDSILANVAWAGANQWEAIWDSEKIPLSSFGGTAWADDFHVWRMDWTSSSIKLYVDDQLLNTTDVTQTINQRGGVNNPFRDTRQHIKLNLALGGIAGGDVTNTTFPSRFEVDYVRVYQLQ